MNPMGFGRIFAFFLFIIACKNVPEVCGKPSVRKPSPSEEFIELALEEMDKKCGPNGHFNCFSGRCACFVLFPHKSHLQLAAKHCEKYQGYIASTHTKEKTDFIVSILESSNLRDGWINVTTDVDEMSRYHFGENVNCYKNVSNSWVQADCTNTRASAMCEIPYDSAPCRPGWAFFRDHCYQFVQDPAPWEKAKETCKCMGASLASIHDEHENTFIAEIMKYSHFWYAWIGLRKPKDSNEFYWDDNSPKNYTKWAQEEPNNLFGVEDAVEIRADRSEWTWNDERADLQNVGICKSAVNMTKI